MMDSDLKHKKYRRKIWRIIAWVGLLTTLGCVFLDAFVWNSFSSRTSTILFLPSEILINIFAVLSFLYLLLVILLLAFLTVTSFLPELQKFRKNRSPEQLRLSAKEFSPRDVRMLNRVLRGEKYEAIAREYGLAVSTFKNKIRLLYKKLKVQDRISFLANYAHYSLVLEEDQSQESNFLAHGIGTP
jgi:DNA-binding CsgD family transcriptional regulator